MLTIVDLSRIGLGCINPGNEPYYSFPIDYERTDVGDGNVLVMLAREYGDPNGNYAELYYFDRENAPAIKLPPHPNFEQITTALATAGYAPAMTYLRQQKIEKLIH